MVQPPALADTHVPCVVPAVVTQMCPVEHCPSLVQPPQKFGAESPQVGVGAAQAVFAVQLPAAHEPEMQTHGLEEPP